MAVAGNGSRRMLVTTAHPDDESFGSGGTLARYCAEGVQVYLACATRGEAGGSDVDGSGGLRGPGLQARAGAALRGQGAGPDRSLPAWLPRFRHGRFRSQRPPGRLLPADVEVVAARLLELIERFRPQVILTSDPYGGYGHPDHIAIHRATLRAWELAQTRLAARATARRSSTTPVCRAACSSWRYASCRWSAVTPAPWAPTATSTCGRCWPTSMPITTRIDVHGPL